MREAAALSAAGFQQAGGTRVSHAGQLQCDGSFCQDLLGCLLHLPVHQAGTSQGDDLEDNFACAEGFAEGAFPELAHVLQAIEAQQQIVHAGQSICLLLLHVLHQQQQQQQHIWMLTVSLAAGDASFAGARIAACWHVAAWPLARCMHAVLQWN